jgi:hypothetical protein
VQVRVSAASQLHDAAKLAGREAVCALLTRPLTALLRDDCSRVQGALMPQLPATLAHLAADTSGGRIAAMEEVIRALLDMEASNTRNWRLQVGLRGCQRAQQGRNTLCACTECWDCWG